MEGIVPEISCSHYVNVGTDSMITQRSNGNSKSPLEPTTNECQNFSSVMCSSIKTECPLASGEEQLPLDNINEESQICSSPGCDMTIKTENPVILKSWSTSAEEQSLLKEVNSEYQNSLSPVCDSTKTPSSETLNLLSSFAEGQPLLIEMDSEGSNQNSSAPICDSTKTKSRKTAFHYVAEGQSLLKKMNMDTPNSSSSLCDSTKTNNTVTLKPISPSVEATQIRNENLNRSSLVCNTTKIENPMIFKALSTSVEEHPPSIQMPNENQKRPSVFSNTNKKEHPLIFKVPQGKNMVMFKKPLKFNVTFGNLVVASLGQMPIEKANAATKEIFDVLMKYGSETNNLK